MRLKSMRMGFGSQSQPFWMICFAMLGFLKSCAHARAAWEKSAWMTASTACPAWILALPALPDGGSPHESGWQALFSGRIDGFLTTEDYLFPQKYM